MTESSVQPHRAGQISAGPASDVKTFAAAVLLTFSFGMLVLVGALLIGVFGGILGVVAGVFGVIWWRSLNGKAFPRDISTGPLTGLIVATILLSGLAWLLA